MERNRGDLEEQARDGGQHRDDRDRFVLRILQEPVELASDDAEVRASRQAVE